MLVILIMGLLTALGPLTIDLYVPAFPVLGGEFGASATELQLTLAATTAGLAVGQLVAGPVSDWIGRRRPLVGAATGLHVVTSVGCAVAPAVPVLIACRFGQGLGAAAGNVLVLAMIRDRASGPRLVRMLARVTLVTTVAPLFAPVVGAQLLGFGWRMIFAVLAAFSGLLLCAVTLLPDNRSQARQSADVLAGARTVLGSRRFLGVVVAGGMVYASIYAYVAASALLFEDGFHLSPAAFSVIFLVNSLGVVVGVQAGGMLARRLGSARMLGCGTVAMLVTALALRIVTDTFGLPALVVMLWLFITACGTCFPPAHALSLDDNGEQAGTAASIFGFSTLAFAAIVTPLTGLFGKVDAAAMSTVLIGCSAVAVLATWIVVKPVVLSHAR
ncbi:Bcr/CflA family efflux MFS transporter [Fodinicola acaciae]|uniref:Bcr/CflA family efflux MFS transporter n=1 Tax=Fodinicola acaciae TaxID=2681555 RepID=UPI0013D504EF|nr:Bcr/CflA family efflux MFS transporter [Fodinicola acaciae]